MNQATRKVRFDTPMPFTSISLQGVPWFDPFNFTVVVKSSLSPAISSGFPEPIRLRTSSPSLSYDLFIYHLFGGDLVNLRFNDAIGDRQFDDSIGTLADANDTYVAGFSAKQGEFHTALNGSNGFSETSFTLTSDLDTLEFGFNGWDGVLDYVEVYADALSPQELAAVTVL